MLLILDENVINNRIHEASFYTCLQMLMMAYKDGLHLVYIPVHRIKELIQDSHVDSWTKSVLMHYHYHEAKQAQNYFSYFTIAINIISDYGLELEMMHSYHNMQTRNIRLNQFTKTTQIQPTVLIGEDDNDAEAYHKIGDYYLRYKHANIRLNFQEQSGGGMNTHKRYSKLYLGGDAVVFCILDADKKTPLHSGYGDTAKAVIKAHRKLFSKYENYKCRYEVLDGFLEIENILPLSFYKDTYNQAEEHKTLFLEINAINNSKKNAIYYFDFKVGVKCFSITKNNNAFQEYWQPILLRNYPDIIQNCNLHVTCKKKDDCSYKIIGGFGTKILEKFLNFYEENSSSIVEIISKEDSVVQDKWKNIGEDVASWGCAKHPVTSI